MKLKCVKCGHEQEVGKFCGLCGGELVAKDTASGNEEETVNDDVSNVEAEVASGQESVQAAETIQSSDQSASGQSSESFDRVVETSKEFGSFFQRFLKTPTDVLSSTSHQMIHSIINLAIIAVLFALTMLRVVQVIFGSEYVSLWSYTFYALLLMALYMVVVIVVLFALNKFFGDESITFEKVVSIYGVLMTPTVIVMALALVLSLIKSIDFAVYLTLFSLLLASLIIPSFIATHHTVNYRKNIDPLYAFLFYIIVTIGLFMVINSILSGAFEVDFTDMMFNSIFGGNDFYF